MVAQSRQNEQDDEDIPESTQAKKRRVPVPVLVLAALALAYAGYRYYLSRQPYEWSGTVEARVVYLGSRVGGRIKEVRVKEGDEVKKGQELIVLEPGDLLAQRLGAEGQLVQARANLDKLEKGARPEELEQARAVASSAAAALQETRAGARREQIEAARARLLAAQVAVDKGQLDERRARELVATKAISQAEADDAEAAVKAAIAQRDAARAALDELEHGARSEDIAQAAARALEAKASADLVKAGARVEDLRAAKGMVDAAQGRLDAIDSQIQELVVTAPVDGRVESLDLRPGTILAPSATAATMVEKGQLYVRMYVPETQLGRVHVGDEVPVNVDSFPGRTFRGKVEHINAVGEYTPRNLQTSDERANQVFATRVGLSDEQDLRAGMAAFVRVPK